MFVTKSKADMRKSTTSLSVAVSRKEIEKFSAASCVTPRRQSNSERAASGATVILGGCRWKGSVSHLGDTVAEG